MNLKSLYNKPFSLLDQSGHRWILILVVVIFTVFFLNVFVPFNSNQWHNDSGIVQFLQFSGFALIGGLTLIITQFGVRSFLAIKSMTTGFFALWVLGEIALVVVGFTLYESLLAGSFSSFFSLIGLIFKYTLLSISIPYSIALLYISYRIRISEIGELRNKTERAVTDLLDLSDEKGVIRFSVSVDQLLYFESADNYVFVYYFQNGKPEKGILRNSLKNVEILVDGLSIIRCHRSFMVNLEKIEFVNYEKAKCQVKLQNIDTFIPVSRKYFPMFRPYLSK